MYVSFFLICATLGTTAYVGPRKGPFKNVFRTNS